ncbi:Flp pilus assembly complex ATPase component TadA [Candidatus Woesearchaeota archaeon]|nr:Flp pilus assembly complex ATPase component TadA [Candidatus Woesearchaeota archaeon]
MEKYVLDTSVIIEGIASNLIKEKKLKGKLIVTNASIAELENQANNGLEIGFIGLEELQKLQEFQKKKKIIIEFLGPRPNLSQIQLARSGEIDALIRSMAHDQKAVLITADKVQAASAKAFGIELKFIEMKKPELKLMLEQYFDKDTMSVHIKEKCHVAVKRGHPGSWKLEKLKDKLTSKQVQELAKDAVEKTRMDPGSFVEISRRGSTVAQFRDYRIVIAKPPISDGWEITVIRPIKKLNIDDYNLPESLFERIKNKAQGILISGETGSGKSTLAQSIAEFYVKIGRITKTVESPRDLQLSDEITQYSKNFTTSEEIHDILFLSRPDNIIFDEIRDTPDFKLYIDLRLAGSSCIGVLHSASPIDAVQRFIGRTETGMIPSVVDTLIFIEAGKIKKVLTLKMKVKVPSGMVEQDLARPVVEVRNFEDNKLEYEIYSYGEETVVIPVEAEGGTAVNAMATKLIEQEFRRYGNVKAELLDSNRVRVYAPKSKIGEIIGREGSNIDFIEKKLGISIDVEEIKERKESVSYNISETKKQETKKHLVFKLENKYTKKTADFYVEDEFILSAIVGIDGEIRINKKSEIGRKILDGVDMNKKVEIKI